MNAPSFGSNCYLEMTEKQKGVYTLFEPHVLYAWAGFLLFMFSEDFLLIFFFSCLFCPNLTVLPDRLA